MLFCMYDSNFQVLDELSRVLNKEMAAMVKEPTNVLKKKTTIFVISMHAAK